MNTMNKSARIILGVILGICGIGIAGFGAYSLLQGPDFFRVLELGGLVLFGMSLMASGLAVAQGRRIREIIDDFLLGSSTH